MAELLLELLSEEIPARMQARAAADLCRLVTERLGKAGLDYSSAESFVTPRRLTLVVDGLPVTQPDVHEERKGPRVGSPDKAIEGFLGSVGLASVDACEIREIKGNEFYFAVIERKGGNTADVLGPLVVEAIRALPWPKSMRWGRSEMSYVRPLHNILCLFDGWPVPGSLDLGGGMVLEFNPKTVGHRFMAPDEILVENFDAYRKKLRKANVIIDPEERKRIIRAQADAIASRKGFSVKEDPGLLDEVAGLVEWPVPLMGSIDDAYMDLPPEVLITSMRSHQKYFSLTNRDGAMAPRFVTVANIETPDDGKAIIAGNERVLRARLSDAKFFWDLDRSQSLASRAPALSEITFHARLGTLDQKIDRIEALSDAISLFVGGADKNLVRTAARLAKADLTTGMVGEFPELQGIMGRYYALHDAEDPAVADAIAEHYSPLGPGDACPTKPVSVAVALADKIDTLVGFFAIDEKPTGSKDPYALRRAALGVIRLVLENRLRLPLAELFRSAHKLLRLKDGPDAEQVSSDLIAFFADRLKVHLREQGVRHDFIAAIFNAGEEDDLVRLLARVDALAAFTESEDGQNLVTAYRRAGNIVRIEAKKDGKPVSGLPDASKFAAPEENTLAGALQKADVTAAKALKKEDFTAAMAALAALREPVDRFFDTVTVNADDPVLRENRLKLLAHIGAIMDRVADFSQLEG